MSLKPTKGVIRTQVQPIHVGCAGWSIPREVAELFPSAGGHLERYAERLPAVEINSSFYRPHRPATYRRWADSVPGDFRFSVKIPKTITHERRLAIEPEILQTFLDEVTELGNHLGCLLMQLPPSLKFERALASGFFEVLQDRLPAPMVCEPRHPSWFGAEADAVLKSHHIARVAADPACVPAASVPGGDQRVVYFRLHGSPRMYYSEYAQEFLNALALQMEAASAQGHECWCIFDNTAAGAAIQNALAIQEVLH